MRDFLLALIPIWGAKRFLRLREKFKKGRPKEMQELIDKWNKTDLVVYRIVMGETLLSLFSVILVAILLS